MLNYKKYYTNEALPWVVFLHGAGGSIATWKYQLDDFKGKYNLLLMDLRDHGESKLVEVENYTFDLIIKDIKSVLDKESIEQAHFMTLSFGSVLLQYLSMQYPKLIKSAIFAGGIFKANWRIKLFVYLARFFNLFLPYKWMYSSFSYLLMPKRHHQNSRKIYQKQSAKLSAKAYLKWVDLYAEFFQLLEKFFHQKIDWPALVIMGKEDYVFLDSALQFQEEHNESVNIQFIHKAGHICNIDKAQEFNVIALDFYRVH